jgi:phytoene dehydrogenase-like protein
MTTRGTDAVVVGSGPNGLAAAITLARAGRSVTVFEAADVAGGGIRSAELTLPGFTHDLCSSVFPFGPASPFFASLDLARHGLRFIDPPIPLGHPLDHGSAVLLRSSVEDTAAGLGADADAWRRLFAPLVAAWPAIADDVLSPFHVPLWPPRTLRLARFGLLAIRSASSVARRFRGDGARALFGGIAAHSMLRLTEPISAAAAIVLAVQAQRTGWPIAAGGAGAIADALVAELHAHGGRIVTGSPIRSLADLPAHRAALFDVAPRHLAAIAGDRLPRRYADALRRYRHGPGTFKLDIALDGEIPWRNPELRRCGTVHLGGTFEEIARGEAAVRAGRVADRPFVLVAPPSNFDPSRAPAGRTTVWAYCHVPNGSSEDASERILAQFERFAPGFRERILAMHVETPADLEARNANNVGGDITGGLQDLGQLFTRPTIRLDPYATPDPALFLCSAATPPGGGVHGMCGLHAAESALRHRLRG